MFSIKFYTTSALYSFKILEINKFLIPKVIEPRGISQYGVIFNKMAVSNIGICQRTINIINCTQEGASLIIEQEAVKKKMLV